VPAVEKSPGPIALPSYVGIAGGCDLSEDSSDYVAAEGSFPGLRAPQVLRPYLNRKKGLALHGGIMTASGMLPPGELVGFAYCVDGTSNTIVVGEQSDWLRNADAEQTGKYHGDAGWDTNGTAGSGPNDGGGFLSGMAVSTRVPVAKPPAFASEVWGVDCYNVTTVRYGLNYKQVQGTTPHPGCSEDHGPNNPLQSAHPGGAHLAFADGAVMAVSDRIDFDVLLLLAIRDDGQRPGEIPLAPPEILPAATPSDSQSGAAEPAGSASEKTALEFVRAAFLERDVAKASTYFDAQAERKTFGKGSAIRSFQQELPHWPPPESLKLREVHFFGKRNLEAMAERFPRFEFTRMAERLEGGLGCLVVFAVKTPDGTERKVPLGFVFQDVAGQMKIVFQDEGT
jgi:prepilin-type processing-associated H-X9-DG protein